MYNIIMIHKVRANYWVLMGSSGPVIPVDKTDIQIPHSRCLQEFIINS